MLRGKLLALLVVGVVGAGAATAAGKGPVGPWARGKFAESPLGKLITGHIGRMMVMRSELNVSDEQKQKIANILVADKKDITKVAKVVWEKRTALRDAVLAEKPDEAAIRKAADDLGKAIGDAAVFGSRVVGEIRPVLTSEQRERIKQCHEDCEAATAKFFTEQLGN